MSDELGTCSHATTPHTRLVCRRWHGNPGTWNPLEPARHSEVTHPTYPDTTWDAPARQSEKDGPLTAEQLWKASLYPWSAWDFAEAYAAYRLTAQQAELEKLRETLKQIYECGSIRQAEKIAEAALPGKDSTPAKGAKNG